jgi:hypothetical protein
MTREEFRKRTMAFGLRAIRLVQSSQEMMLLKYSANNFYVPQTIGPRSAADLVLISSQKWESSKKNAMKLCIGWKC